MLPLKDRNSISKRFPKLTYQEKKINKIVKADYYRCIPKGKKYYAWFTIYKNKGFEYDNLKTNFASIKKKVNINKKHKFNCHKSTKKGLL